MESSRPQKRRRIGQEIVLVTMCNMTGGNKGTAPINLPLISTRDAMALAAVTSSLYIPHRFSFLRPCLCRCSCLHCGLSAPASVRIVPAPRRSMIQSQKRRSRVRLHPTFHPLCRNHWNLFEYQQFTALTKRSACFNTLIHVDQPQPPLFQPRNPPAAGTRFTERLFLEIMYPISVFGMDHSSRIHFLQNRLHLPL